MAAFVDTNILLYALSRANALEVEKVAIAKALLAELTKRTNLCLSAQVLSESVTNAMRKGTPPLSLSEASKIVGQLSQETVIPIDATLVQLALRRVEQSRISYWDALIGRSRHPSRRHHPLHRRHAPRDPLRQSRTPEPLPRLRMI